MLGFSFVCHTESNSMSEIFFVILGHPKKTFINEKDIKKIKI
jgi:hypothetical protein